jgi:DNA mismatch repair protein MutL
MFIDQHAAHEAILYRHFVLEYKNQKQKNKSFQLNKSTLLSVSLTDSQIIKQYFDIFEKLGFELEEFGDNVYKINAVPALIKDLDATAVILEMLDDLREEKLPKKIDKKTNKMLQYLACRSAIKAGQKLNKEDIKKLIKQLQKQDYIYTCPHGRPVKVEISLNEFAKLFKRI